MNKPIPRVITQALLLNVQALYQNEQIDTKEKNELTTLIRKGLSEGYEDLKKKLEYLNKVISMSFLTQEMLDMLSENNQTKEDILYVE